MAVPPPSTIRRTPAPLLLLAALLVVATVLRLRDTGAFALTHYDEGAYALSAAAVARGEFPGGMFSGQRFLAPPLLVLVAGGLSRVAGIAADRALLWTSVSAGIATVALLFWLGRAWFGTVAGLAAALLVALLADHRALSQIGLTDVLFSALFFLALAAHARLLARQRWRDAVLAGLATGLAWNCKYHGWLAVPVAGLAALPGLVRGPARVRPLALLTLAGLVAAAVYAPWALWVEAQEGGYRALAQNHMGYLATDQLLPHVATQVRAHQLLDDLPSLLALPLATLAAALVAGDLRARWPVALALGLGSLLVGLWAGTVAALALLTLVHAALLRRHAAPGAATGPGAALAWACLLCFTVLTPFYHPYARLLLPWKLSACLLAGGLLQRSLAGAAPARPAALTTACALVLAPLFLPGARPALGPDFRAAAAEVARHAGPGLPILVASEPALCFYLQAAGARAWPADGLWLLDTVSAQTPVVWVEGRYARERDELARWRTAHPDAQVTTLATVPVRPGLIRLLDDNAPAAVAEQAVAEPAPYRCVLFRARR